MSFRIKFFVLLLFTMVAYLAAISRGQSLPWLMASLLSAALIMGVVWPRWLVQRLRVSRSGPERAWEGDDVVFEVEMSNRGFLPRFMIELSDRLPFVGAAHAAPGQRDHLLGTVNYLPARKSHRFQVSVSCEKRGDYQLGPLSLATSFPLDLIRISKHTAQGRARFTIYPSLFPILSLPLNGALNQIHRGGFRLTEGAGAAEFCGLREYRRGDNPRHIHWPTTARLNELMVKEFEPLAAASLCVALDLNQASNVGVGKHSTLEYAVRIAASLAHYACSQNLQHRLLANGAQAIDFVAQKGESHYQAILDVLAVVEADGVTPYAQVLSQIALSCSRGETVVVLLSEAAAHQPQTLSALSALRNRGAHLFAVIFDRNSFVTSAAPSAIDPALSILQSALLDLKATCIRVRRGDDLTKLFNA